MFITHIGNYLNIRGSGKINKGSNSTIIKVPLEKDFQDYDFLDITIHLTPYVSSEELDVNAVSRIYTAGKFKNDSFIVYGDEGSFYWSIQITLQHKYEIYSETGF
jgi:hypothetical protein